MTQLVSAAAEHLLRYPYRVWHYGDSVGFEGLLAAATLLNDDKFPAFGLGVARAWGARAEPFRELDLTAPGLALFRLATIFDDGPLFAALRKLTQFVQSRPRVENVVTSFEVSPLMRPYGGADPGMAGDELLKDPGPGVFVDCLHFVPPLLVEAGAAFQDDGLIDDGAKEAVAMIDLLQEPDGLFAHFYLERTGSRYGQGWGRGQGWALLGLLDVLDRLPPEHSQRHRIATSILSLLEALVRTQRVDGHWHTPVEDPTSPVEVSTAFFVAAGVPRAARAGIVCEGGIRMGESAWGASLASVTGDGTIAGVSHAVWASTHLSHYRHVPRGAQVPWGQGPFVLAAAEQVFPGQAGERIVKGRA